MKRLSSLIATGGCALVVFGCATFSSDRFASFPPIGQFRPGERSTVIITSDGITNVVRPKWTRAMGDLGGWPVMYRYRDTIVLQYPHVDAHRGRRLEATSEQVQWISRDEGRSWEKPPLPLPVAKEVVVAPDRVLYYRNQPGGPTKVCVSTDGVTFSEWKDVYKAPFWLWGAMYDPVSKLFWAPPHAIPEGKDKGSRQIHLIKSRDGIDWEYVSTVHANQDESESCFLRVLQGVCALEVETATLAWQEEVLGPSTDPLVAMDGKTAKHSGVHLTGVISLPSHRCLGVEPVADKSNEIPAAQKLIARAPIRPGQMVSLDAMHTQHKTMAQILYDKGADYLLPITGNQGTLLKTAQQLLPESVPPSGREAGEQSQPPRTAGSGYAKR